MKLKVVCLNLWIGGIFFEDIVSFCKEQQADIYLFQEVFHSENSSLEPQLRSHRELQKRLALPYEHFAPAFIENVEGIQIPQGNSILSRYPITESSVTYYDVPYGPRVNEREFFHLSPRNLQHVVISIDSKDLHVFNTQGIWGEDGGDNPRRIKMSKLILSEIEKTGFDQNVLLAGDFNVRPDTKTVGLLEEKLHTVFQNELTTSFNLQQKDLEKYPGFAEAVVDMMFVSSSVRVIAHECPIVNISDHLPLIAEIEVS